MLNPHLQYKLYPSAHPQVIARYTGQARALRDYAQAYANDTYNMKNKNFYNFFITTAKALDPTISMYVNDPNEVNSAYRAKNRTVDGGADIKNTEVVDVIKE